MKLKDAILFVPKIYVQGLKSVAPITRRGVRALKVRKIPKTPAVSEIVRVPTPLNDLERHQLELLEMDADFALGDLEGFMRLNFGAGRSQ